MPGKAGQSLFMRIACVLAALAVLISMPAKSLDLPEEGRSLIRLQSRVFDLGTDARRIRRDPHFIPITEVGWIWTLTNSDPELHATVIHIRSFANSLGEPIWMPDVDREQYAPAEDLADAWALKDFDVRWRHKIAPSTRGDVMLFPKSAHAGYFVSCAYDRADPVPTFCAVNALYPPDPNLRIKVRIYQITDPLNDFRAIADRALNLVYCLDVTRALEAGEWTPLRPETSQSLTQLLGTCKNLQS